MLFLKKIINSTYWIIIIFSLYYILSFLSIQAIEEKNKFLVEEKCKGCHPVRLVMQKNKRPDEWESTVIKMQAKMKFLTPDESKKIIEYLAITRAKNDDIIDEIEIMDNAMKQGEKLFNDISLGNNGKSCMSCHNDKQNSLRKKAFIYPKYFSKAKKLVNLEQRINYCIMNFMEGEALKLGSEEIIILTMYLYSLL